jgi:predicted CXXCH cytochrome family protein
MLATSSSAPAAGELPSPSNAPGYVGRQACAPCHAAETKLWKGSHHDLAMQVADATTVRGNFDGAVFEKDGVTTTFLRRDGKYLVRTDGPDGKLHEYPVKYVFGVDPLQQVLLELPGGRLQALSIAWDTRPRSAGGQRWFHLYPKEKIDHRDVLHWTGPAQNWNHMCADCHSTNVVKGYDAAQDRFATTFSEIDVSCEACHGPGSRHVAWEEEAKRGTATPDPLHGLIRQLRDTSGGSFAFPPGASIAKRTAPPSSRAEIETCGRCHSRRAQIWRPSPGDEPLAQSYRVALLDAGTYHADGQILDEDYEYGSFLQSPMYAAGVTCSNCHDPHSGKLRAAGNAVCGQCHLSATYDSPKHHFHPTGSNGARCVSCHMIERVYMGIDGRRDHGFRVPRPDLSVKLGTPNACNDCHADKSAQWSAAAVEKWYGPNRRSGWHWAEAIDAGRRSAGDAESQLLRVIDDSTQAAIVRASALSLVPNVLGPRSASAASRALHDDDPLVRRAAAEAAASFDPGDRPQLVAPLLADPVRTVRLAALASLLDLPRQSLSSEQASALDREIAEYRAVQALNADRADAQVNLGMLEARLGRDREARAAFDKAIRLQPSFVPAYVNRADLSRRAGNEADAEADLRRALAVDPQAAPQHEALGLSLVRQKRIPEALPELAKAAQLAPDVPRHAYVYAIALHDTGDGEKALAVLRQAYQRSPGSREILSALIEYETEAGHQEAALGWRRELAARSAADATRGPLAP